MGLIRSNLRRVFLLSGLVLCLALLLSPAGASAANSRRIGTKPSVPSGATAVGGVPQSTQLSVTVTLQPRDPAALSAYASDVSTPGSSVYHQYLSVSEFAQRFGPTRSAISAAEASMRAEGLTPGRLAPNGLSFPVTASAARMSSGFHTSFERYHLKSGRTAFANTSAPLVTGSGASVIQGVVGLNNLAMEQPQGFAQKPGIAPLSGLSAPRTTASSAVSACSAAQGAGAYTASQIASAYGFNGLYNAGDLGSGVTVALYELEPYASSDISTYQSCYGTSTSVTNVTVGGGSLCNGDPNCGLEDVLDIEDVIGLVPGATIHVYEGPNTNSGAYNTYRQIVIDNTAKVISTSWGECESELGSSMANSENTLFQEAATQGQSIFAAAGDSGTEDCTSSATGKPTGGPSVDDPASQPYVTGVGGTKLSSLGPPPSETVWNDYPAEKLNGGAGGGGVSTLWSMPSYQSGFAQSQSSISCGSGGNSCREVPDVSADAAPSTGYDVYWVPATTSGAAGWPANDWGAVGGTSAATPTWASLIALEDALPGCSSRIGFANPGLYSAAGSDYASDFNDITTGDNSYYKVTTGYSAGVGYDMASGLGSPQGADLTGSLCGIDFVFFPSLPAPTSAVLRPVTPVQVQAQSSAGATPTSYSATGLPPGLSIDTSSGRITGTPTAAGTYTVTVQAGDSRGGTGTGVFRWVVSPSTVTMSGAPSSVHGRVGVPIRTAALSFTDSVGAPVTYTATGLPAGLSISKTTGVISGTPTQAANTTVTIKAADAYGGSASQRFPLVVAGLPRISASKLRISGTKGSLSLTLRAGQYAPSLKKVQLIEPRGAHLAGGRTPGRYVNAFTLAGKRQTVTRSLSHGKLLVRLKTALSAAQLRLTGSELTFTKALASGLSHRTKKVKLTLVLTDVAGTQTRLSLTLR